MIKMRYKVLVCLIALALLAQTSTVYAKTTIKMWGMGAEGENLKPMLKEFEALNPDIKVELQAIPWGSAHEKLLVSVAGGIPPDICQLGTTWMAEFAFMGALHPLDDLVAKSAQINKENYFEGSWKTAEIEGHIYGIPWYVDTRLIFYRTDIFKNAGYDKVPQTWDELKEAAKKIRQKSNNENFAWQIIPGDEFLFQQLVWANGGDILAPDNKGSAVLSPEVQEAFDYMYSYFKEHIVPLKKEASIDVFTGFQTGYYAMFISGPWNVAMLKAKAPDIDGKWAVAPMPKKKKRTSFVGGSNLVIFKDSKNKEAAFKLIEFFNRPENQVKFYQIVSALPSVKKAWEDPVLKGNPLVEPFGEQMKDVKAPPTIPEWEEIAFKIQLRMAEALYGMKTTNQALQDLDADINKILR